MRPNEGPSPSNFFEVEISPTEFFQDVGVMVVESRLPDYSKSGMKAGVHSWPITRNSKKSCCKSNLEAEPCKMVASTRSKIQLSFEEKQCLYIKVYITLEEDDFENLKHKNRVSLDKMKSNMVLLEKWKVKVIDSCNNQDTFNVNMVLQAVRSYVHFSQLSSWLASSQGLFPHTINHRITTNEESDDFLNTPVFHKFPLADISNTESIQIEVASLPRMEVPSLLFLLKQEKNSFTFDGGGKPKDPRLHRSKLPDDKIIEKEPNSTHFLFSKNGHGVGKRKDENLDKYYCSSHSEQHHCRQIGYAGQKCMRRESDFDVGFSRSNKVFDANENLSHPKQSLSLALLLNQRTPERTKNHDRNGESSDFGSIHNRNESPLSLSQLLESEDKNVRNINNYRTENVEADRTKNNVYPTPTDGVEATRTKDENLSSLLQDVVLSQEEENNETEKDSEIEDDDDDDLEAYNYDEDITPEKFVVDEHFAASQQSQHVAGMSSLKPCQRRMRSKSVSPNFVQRQQADCSKNGTATKPIAARRLAMVAGTVPIFNAKTGLPLSSSPAPIKKPRKISESSCGSNLSKSSSLDDLQPCALGLSKSAPAPSSLLGNFEESVLNGRMPINGFLEGFWAKLGASGTFCPKHINIPMEIQYFSLSDDNAPSPYLGRITLRDKKKRKRYRVPRKGTVQLTIFNPNKTVVKVFVVVYNFEDMPDYTRTFLRQKIVAADSTNSKNDVPTLHYLIHLSFVSSKSSHIYLHSDIRVLFRQRAPDEPLKTITNGPTNPKYTSITKRSHPFKGGSENDDSS